MTALHYASENGRTKIIRFLLVAGASPALLDKDGKSRTLLFRKRCFDQLDHCAALWLACSRDRLDTVIAFLETNKAVSESEDKQVLAETHVIHTIGHPDEHSSDRVYADCLKAGLSHLYVAQIWDFDDRIESALLPYYKAFKDSVMLVSAAKAMFG